MLCWESWLDYLFQPFDLTDLDWSPELWIAYHDDDEQNARLAQRLWEDNGLDVPEGFSEVLQPYLGKHCTRIYFIQSQMLTFESEHENAYVRSSAATAIAEAVEQMPRKAAEVLHSLQEYYLEKAKILAPEFDEYVRIFQVVI